MNSLKIILPTALALFAIIPAIGGSAVEACPRHYRQAANSHADDARHYRTVRMWYAARYLDSIAPQRRN
jgi:hypothetical protein